MVPEDAQGDGEASGAENEPLPPALSAGLEDVLDALRLEAGLAAATLAAYRSDLEAFLRFAAARGLRAWPHRRVAKDPRRG